MQVHSLTNFCIVMYVDMACIITQYGSTVYIGMAMGGSAL